jgi:hypothetical protein
MDLHVWRALRRLRATVRERPSAPWDTTRTFQLLALLLAVASFSLTIYAVAVLLEWWQAAQ